LATVLPLVMIAVTTAGPNGTAEASSVPKTHVVIIRDFVFSPSNLVVRPGDKVVWKNEDIVPHTATGKGFDSGKISQGESWSFVVKNKGSFSYICSYHPTMQGRFAVK
jgi:plastocyanin